MKKINKAQMKFSLIVLILYVLSLLPAYAAQTAVVDKGVTQVEDREKTEIIIKYKDENQKEKVKNNIKTKLKIQKLETKMSIKKLKIDVLRAEKGSDVSKIINELKKDPSIEYVQPNYKLEISTLPSDSDFINQWGLLNNGQDVNLLKGRTGVDINICNAWDLTQGQASVVIGILDTGVDINHNDLKESTYVNTSEIPGNNIDDDNNGYIDDVNGWDFANDDSTVFDSSIYDVHGTHVAGIIAAKADSTGVVGVAPNVKIMPLKFINDGVGYTCDIIEAINYAAAMGVKIVNCSFGGTDNNQALKDAMQNSGMLFVCSAGNRGEDVSISPIYPAAFDLPNIISVTAIDSLGVIAPFSSYGSSVDIAAPGVNIFSTVPNNQYEYMSGTSVATAYITGTAALLKSYIPNIKPTDIISRIKSNSIVCTSLQGKISSSGRLDANAAIKNEVPQQDNYDGPGGNYTAVLPATQGTGTDSWYSMNELSNIEERLHYGENGIDPKSGNYSVTYNDIIVPSVGFDVNISRSYNCNDNTDSSILGVGWVFGFDGSVATSHYSMTINLPNGSSDTLASIEGMPYISKYTRSSAVYVDGGIKYTTKDKYEYFFKCCGTNIKLVWMQDRNGNRINIIRDSDGKITEIIDSVGRSYACKYNVNNLLESVTDPVGRMVNYDYLKSDNKYYLEKVKDPVGNITKYTYEDNTRYLRRLKTIENPENSKLIDIVYNGSNRGITVNDIHGNKYEYNFKYGLYNTVTHKLDARRTIITDANHKEWTYTYHDSENNSITEITDPEGRTSRKYLNSSKEIVTSIDRNGNKTEYIRDNLGNIITVINPDMSIKERAYDSSNNLTLEKDENGNCTYYRYDKLTHTNLEKKVQPLNVTDLYPEDDEHIDKSRFAITEYTYYTKDEANAGFTCNVGGLLESVTDPENGMVEYEYDCYGNRESESDPETGKLKKIEYNEPNGKVGLKTAEISAMGFRTEYTYNANGQLEKTIQHKDETTRVVYNIFGQKIKEVSPNQYDVSLEDVNTHVYTGDHGYRYSYYTSGKLKTVTDPQDNTTEYTYDFYGNKLTEKKQSGAVYRYEYDGLNRIKKEFYSDSAASPEILLKEYSYEVLSGGETRKIEIEYLNASEKATSTYVYDYANRLIEQRNPDGSLLKNSYYPNGEKMTTTDTNGAVSHYEYDGLNRLSKQWTALELKDGKVRYTYTQYDYDKAGRKTREKIGKEKVEYPKYPTTFIIKEFSYFKNGKLKSVSDNEGRKTEYKYDDDGNTTNESISIDSTDVIITEYVYNHFNKPNEKKVKVRKRDIFGNEYNQDGDMILTTLYTYDKNGNLETETTPDEITKSYTYDKMNRQISISQPGRDENENIVTIENSVTYDWKGNPLSETDGNENTTRFEYDPKGLLLKTIDANGGVLAFYYDRAGRKVAEVKPKHYSEALPLNEMNRIEYVYDSMGRVVTEKDVYKDTAKGEWITIHTKSYKYDLDGNIIKELDALGYESGQGTALISRIDTGYGTEYTYNLSRKMLTKLDPETKSRGIPFTARYEYDVLGRKVSETNTKGVVTTFEYDDEGNLLKIKVRKNTKAQDVTLKTNTYDLVGRKKTEIDGNGNTTTYDYNSFNKVSKVVFTGDNSIPGNTILNQYNVMGNLAKTEDSMGRVDLYSYDSQGRQLDHTQQRTDGRETIMTSVSYDKNGNKRFETDGRDNKKEYKYNALNQLKSVQYIVGTTTKTTSYTYDANGNQETMTDWRGNTFTNVYDPLNRLIEKKDPYTTVQKFKYNKNSAQVESTDALGNKTVFQYDKNNRLSVTIDPENHKTSQTYDNIGNIETKTDGRNNTTTYEYNELNKLVKVKNPKNEVTMYTYDLNGNMLTQVDGKEHVTTFEYNAANKLERRVDHGGRTAISDAYKYNDSKMERYTYYPDGGLKTKIDRNGLTTYYTYDIHGKMTSQQAGEIQISYTYDENGNMSSMTDATGTTARQYDEENRVIQKDVPQFGTMTFQYDTPENDGCKGEISTDPKGNTTKKIYDRAGRLIEVTAEGRTTTYTYYDNGNRKSIINPDGTTEEYTYYKDNLNESLTNKKADGIVLEAYSYIYDDAHNQTSKTDKKGKTSYTYDSLNRLETMAEPSGKYTRYTYDAAGNRETEEVTESGSTTVTTYDYNNQNRLMQTMAAGSGIKEIVQYSYDNNGNMVYNGKRAIKQADAGSQSKYTVNISGQNDTSGASFYSYDEMNRLIKTTGGDKITRYRYNGDGLRVEKEVNGAVTRYLYEGDKVILEADGSGNETAWNVHGINTISRTVDGETVYYMYNGHADVTALIGTDGTIAAEYYYDAFGNPVAEGTNENGINNPIRYAGYQWDETGLYYLNARFYDPKIARFITEDTYRGDPNDPLSLNLYTYCHNEPIMYIDPTGHKALRGDEDERKPSKPEKKNPIKKIVEKIDKAKTAIEVVKTIIEKVAPKSSIVPIKSIIKVAPENKTVVETPKPSPMTAPQPSNMIGKQNDTGQRYDIEPKDAVLLGFVEGLGLKPGLDLAFKAAGKPPITSADIKGNAETTPGFKESYELGQALSLIPAGSSQAATPKPGMAYATPTGQTVIKPATVDITTPIYFADGSTNNNDSQNEGANEQSKKLVPNPNGKNGSLAHQNKIDEVVSGLESEGYTVIREYKVDTPGGNKNTRYADVYGKNNSTGDEVLVQVGRQTKSGLPVSRERKAIEDLKNIGEFLVKFVPYFK